MPNEARTNACGGDSRAACRAGAQMKMVWDESGACNVFANVAQVKASREEFMLLFGKSQREPGDLNELSVALDRRIVLAPITAKRLAVRLADIIRDYESEFGVIDGKVQLLERLEPTPPLRPPAFRSLKGAEKAARLFGFLEEERVKPAFERSCEFLANTLLGNRFLLGFEKNMIRRSPHEKISGICLSLDMPEDFLAAFLENLGEANIVGFGFGEHAGTCIVKAYLEFGSRFYRAIKSEPHRSEPYLSHLGFKWDAEDNTRKALARYTCFPARTAEEIQAKLSGDFYRDKDAGPFKIIRGILDLALNRAGRQRFPYLAVREENNPRSSFDINLYSANLQLQEIHSFLLDVCRHYAIPEEQFLNFYDPAKTHILGHLAGGRDREERDFLTLYYGE